MVFVVETTDKSNAAVRALRRSDGTEVWTTRWAASGKVPFFAAANGDWVRSTPAWDGRTLYVGDMEEKIMALDGSSGEVRWTLDFSERFGTKVPDFGFASSPLIDADALYVQAANSIVKVDRATGKTIWRRFGQAPGFRGILLTRDRDTCRCTTTGCPDATHAARDLARRWTRAVVSGSAQFSRDEHPHPRLRWRSNRPC